jgi:hypothetical protein
MFKADVSGATLSAVAVMFLAGCGGSDAPHDNSGSFTGTWRGQLTSTVAGGSSVAAAGTLTFTRTADNSLNGDDCGNDPRTSWRVTSSSRAQIEPVNCRVNVGGGACLAHVRITGGTFVLSNGRGRVDESGVVTLDNGSCAGGPQGSTFNVTVTGSDLVK